MGTERCEVLLVGARFVRERGCVEAMLERRGLSVRVAEDEERALRALRLGRFAAIVVSLGLEDGRALAVADFARWRMPEAPVIFLSGGPAFADGSIFRHSINAVGMVPATIPVSDLVEVIAFRALPPGIARAPERVAV